MSSTPIQYRFRIKLSRNGPFVSTKFLSSNFGGLVYVLFMTACDFYFDLAQPSQNFIVSVNLMSRYLYVKYVTTFLRYMIIDGQHLYPFHSVVLASFVNLLFLLFPFWPFFPLSYLCLPLETTILQGLISMPSSITPWSHFLLFLNLKSCWCRLSWWNVFLW